MDNLYAVIMAGGSGTRFWPLSREAMPKQLLRIDGGETLIQQTIARVSPLVPTDRIYIVTNKNHAEPIRFQVPEIRKENYIIEPVAKNTAAAIGLAAIHINHHNPDGVMAVLAADHVIRHKDRFLDTLKDACGIARSGYLVTIGIRPTRPETGYGYIEAGEKLEIRSQKSETEEADAPIAFRVLRFVEKPDIETARAYVEAGSYYWNSGMFVWRAGVILEEIGRHMVPLYKGLKKIESSFGKGTEESVTGEVFPKLESISIDYAVMEKSDKVVVVPADLGWNDVGSWTALDKISNRDANGNVITGNVVDVDSKDSIIYAANRLVATLGLKDTVVVDTEDATLVCRKDRAQDVKKIVAELKRRGAEERVTHRTVVRPWGSYTLLEKGERYKIKRIVVNPGARLSLQMHHHRSEHWVVVSGTAKVRRGEEVFFVNPNESTYISMEMKHRLENPGKIPLQLIEVQNGEYLEEDDIIRFDDEYGRE
ncbi:MAG: mannose-1-phosphate guanylyltransferase/mannose-6-phosphate isomerase [Nitrospirae bacterium]|nr:mannose-1-phosphate guanylyltransferase/mannose-6-phosphate isomerase [Nitrospirota bacterium]